MKTFFSKVGRAGVGETCFPHRRHPERGKDTLWRAPVREERTDWCKWISKQANE